MLPDGSWFHGYNFDRDPKRKMRDSWVWGRVRAWKRLPPQSAVQKPQGNTDHRDLGKLCKEQTGDQSEGDKPGAFRSKNVAANKAGESSISAPERLTPLKKDCKLAFRPFAN